MTPRPDLFPLSLICHFSAQLRPASEKGRAAARYPCAKLTAIVHFFGDKFWCMVESEVGITFVRQRIFAHRVVPQGVGWLLYPKR